MTSLIKIEGIGAKYVEKLRAQGIRSTEALLTNGATPKNRQDLAARSGVSETLILEWVNLADLFRIKGIGEEYSDLLEEAGVDTVPELAQRNPANLYETLLSVNQKKKLVRKLPTQAQVSSWVSQAKALPRLITY
jgi:predicted flap endonuclease-1-like 5' DNA nuclease